jgi:transcriptional regulator with XRE-family HTH domain
MEVTCDAELLGLIKLEMFKMGIREMDLARRTGIRQSSLNRFMNGYGSMRTESMFKVIKVLGIKLGGKQSSTKEDYRDLKFQFTVCFLEEVEAFKNIPEGFRPAFNSEEQRKLCERAADRAIEKHKGLLS